MSENRRLFPGMRVPEPPEDLRRHVLGRARQALETEPRPDLWTRIWESRQLRLTWGVSVLALAVCHLLVPAGEAIPARGPSMLAQTESDDHEELAVIANLPRISLEVLPVAVDTPALGETETDPESALPALSEENES